MLDKDEFNMYYVDRPTQQKAPIHKKSATFFFDDNSSIGTACSTSSPTTSEEMTDRLSKRRSFVQNTIRMNQKFQEEAGKPFRVWRERFIEDRCCEKEDIKKEFFISSLPHILLNILLVSYWIFGAFVFRLMEPTIQEKSVYESVLFTFITTTTIGWGNICPVTYWGRWFCILYIVIGTPLTYVVLGNNGQFLVEGYWILRKSYSKRKNVSYHGDLPIQVSLSFLFIHILIGGVIYSFWADKMPFITSFYFSFISITTIGYGEVIPATDSDMEYLVTFIYLSIGVILVTMFMGSMSKYLQQIHYIGRKISGSEDVQVWFGGKMMTVRELVEMVAQEFEVSPLRLQAVLKDLDDILMVATNEQVTNKSSVLRKKAQMIRSESLVMEVKNGLQKSFVVTRCSDPRVSPRLKNGQMATPLLRVESDPSLQKIIARENENTLQALRVINHTLQKQYSMRRSSKDAHMTLFRKDSKQQMHTRLKRSYSSLCITDNNLDTKRSPSPLTVAALSVERERHHTADY